MEKDINIEEQSSMKDTSEASAQLPINFLKVGSVDSTDVQVYIHQSVCSALEKYSRSDMGNELGSILLGAYSTAIGQTAVIVSEYIEAKYTDASASTLTFTHETWDYVHKEQAEKYPKLRIVGWQHTHPGYGIFLSNYDMFIQENFFNLPFQIAYVIDPVQNIRGFFCWENGRVEKLKGYYIFDEPGEIIVPPSEGEDGSAIKSKEAAKLENKKKSGLIAALTALAVACVALLAAVVFLGLRLSESGRQIEELFAVQHNLKEQIQSFSINQSSFNSEINEKAGSLEGELADVQKKLGGVQAFIAEAEAKEPDDTISFEWYFAVEGDSLPSICESKGIDYEQSKEVLFAINGLDEETILQEGQALLIPKIKDR